MCGLDPNGLRGCPGFALSIQLWFIQATDEADAGELRWSTFLKRGCLEGWNTDTRTKDSSWARVALADGLPMTEFLRARRDLTVIGGPMDMVGGGGWENWGTTPDHKAHGQIPSTHSPKAAKELFRGWR